MFELIYTSAPHGLLPGRSGFATVAMTAGMPPNLITPLENLSGYNFTYRNGTLPAEYNPVCCTFIRMRYGNWRLYIASRIAPNGLDYSQRNNKIAHHLLFETPAELSVLPAGVAGIFGCPGNFQEDFQGEPRELRARGIRRSTAPAELPAAVWQRMTGDAGWAGAAAEWFLNDAARPLYVEYPRGIALDTLLNMLTEVTALLPAEQRGEFTFSTFFSRETPGSECFLRMVPEDSPLLGNLKRFHADSVLTLGTATPIPPRFESSKLVELARRGRPQPLLAVATPAASVDEPAVPQSPAAAANTEPAAPTRLKLRAEPGGRPTAAPETAAVHHVRITREYVDTTAANRRKLIILGGIGLFLLLVLGTVYWKVWQETSQPTAPAPPTPEQVAQEAVPPVQDGRARTPEYAVPSALPAPTAEPAAPPVPVVTTEPRHRPAAEASPAGPPPLAINPTRLSEARLPDASLGFTLLRSWRRAKRAGQDFEIQLPPALDGCLGIYVELERIGSEFGNLKNFISQRDNESIWIVAGKSGSRPLQPAPLTADSPRLTIQLDKNNRRLRFWFNEKSRPEYVLPKADGISALYFALPEGRLYRWSPRFQREYLARLKHGSVTVAPDGQLSYKPSDDEKLAGGDIEIFIGKVKLPDAKVAPPRVLPFMPWNQAVERYESAKADCDKYQHEQTRRQVTSNPPPAMKELDDALDSLEKSCRKSLDKTSIAATVNGQVMDFLKRFNTTAYNGQNPPSAELQHFIDEAAKTLNNALGGKRSRKKLLPEVSDYHNRWRAELDAIAQLPDFIRKYAEKQKILNSASTHLHDQMNAMFSVADTIAPEIKPLMIKYMSSGNNTSPDRTPEKIGGPDCNIVKELEILLNGKIRHDITRKKDTAP